MRKLFLGYNRFLKANFSSFSLIECKTLHHKNRDGECAIYLWWGTNHKRCDLFPYKDNDFRLLTRKLQFTPLPPLNKNVAGSLERLLNHRFVATSFGNNSSVMMFHRKEEKYIHSNSFQSLWKIIKSRPENFSSNYKKHDYNIRNRRKSWWLISLIFIIYYIFLISSFLKRNLL